jgi:hypothetical protein
VVSDEEWKAVCDELLQLEPSTSAHRQSLQVVLAEVDRREAARAGLERAYGATKAALDASLEKVLKIAVPVYETISERLVLAEQDILLHVSSNYETKNAILQALESTNAQWNRKYNRFLSRINLPKSGDGTPPEEGGDEEDEDQGKMESNAMTALKEKQKGSGGSEGEKEEQETEGIPDPDWDAIMDFDPASREKIELFLDARDQYYAADSKFQQALDEIHANLKASHESILQTVSDAYNKMDGDILDVQYEDIQEHIVSNHRTRQGMERALESAVQQQQNMFARLLARVGGGFLGGDSSRATTGSSFPNPLARAFQRNIGAKRKQPGGDAM